MSAPNDGQSQDELEQHLRSMILGNVRIGENAPQNFQKENYHSTRGRGNYGPRNQEPRTQNGQHQAPPYANQPQHMGQGAPPMQVVQRQQYPSSPARGYHGNHHGPHPHNRHSGAAPSKFAPLYRQPRVPSPEEINAQCMFLESVAGNILPHIEMSLEEINAKEQFRIRLETICQQALVKQSPEDYTVIGLASFGSLASGFGMPGSDMDLVLQSSRRDVDLRLLEKALLEDGLGAHLLARTRVPILKVCEKPTPELFAALCAERKKYDEMTPEGKEEYDHPKRKPEVPATAEDKAGGTTNEQEKGKEDQHSKVDDDVTNNLNVKSETKVTPTPKESRNPNSSQPSDQNTDSAMSKPHQPTPNTTAPTPRTGPKPWYREKRPSALDFPSDNSIGIQTDININNTLGLHNTRLLRAYCAADIRIRLLVLFLKAWASRRKINSPRNSTLSSYGYVLMALHYCVNVARPPICPNLQLGTQSGRFDAAGAFVPPADADAAQLCDGCDVRFCGASDAELQHIQALAAAGALSRNAAPLGVHLRDLFAYYATQNAQTPGGGFSWTTSVLSLRTPGGIVSKEAKGWTGAKTTVESVGEVRHRYLFAIEDPFELGHNVARTVTHNGIVAIRDEFRRAWRIVMAVGAGRRPEGELLEELVSIAPPKEEAEALEQQQETRKVAGVDTDAGADGKPGSKAAEMKQKDEDQAGAPAIPG